MFPQVFPDGDPPSGVAQSLLNQGFPMRKITMGGPQWDSTLSPRCVPRVVKAL